MKIISISGLDGSGKSTQIHMLQEHLEKNGKKVYYFHAVTFSIAQLLHRKKISDSQKHPDVTSASWRAIQMRKIALFCDMIRFRTLIWRLSRAGYTHMLSDRYFFDMIVNIAYLSHKTYMPFFYTLLVRPDHAFYLAVDPDEIMRRKNAPAQGLSYLITKDALYQNYTKKFHLFTIDGYDEPLTIFRRICAKIGAL